ncbi:unnamed protein product [Parascedosporium putredinis]|uniref:CENP-V/GFA domain-containing protein n=1 Tax=Parascedosporium putredinis TaxID=1442378 RepID=A0A9P1M8H8_9PEZI|nr:unnamed protein product [Parascedosporium putredinis]CAI7988936.1 unnamed protein product [Parascedosporium putredinis]
MPTYKGRCVCDTLQYSVSMDSPDAARTSLCHCLSCRRAFGTNYGLTTKNCGAFICEYGEQAADKFRYVMWGTFDQPDSFPPKGEFFCEDRTGWMPEIPDIFHKAEIKE